MNPEEDNPSLEAQEIQAHNSQDDLEDNNANAYYNDVQRLHLEPSGILIEVAD